MSFERIQGAILSGLGLLVTILAWIFKPETTLPLIVVLPICAIACLAILTLIGAVFQSLILKNRLPAVRYVRKAVSGHDLVLLLDPSELFSQNAVVSFYHLGDAGFEQFIGIGSVLNIQEDQRIQVAMSQTVDGYDDVLEGLQQNRSTMLEKIRVKPIADMRTLRALAEGLYGQ